MTIIQHTIWLYHRFPLIDRDVQELLHQRGIVVSDETLREWCVKFGPLFAEDLHQREPHRSSRWHMDEVCTSVDGARHWLWRAVDEYGFVIDILLQRHRDTEAAKTFLTRLLGAYDVPEVIHTDQLRSDGAATREIPHLVNINHQQVISTARCNNVTLQEHRSTKATRAISARIQTKKTRSRIPESARPSDQPPPSFPHQRHRHPKKQPKHSVSDVVCGRGRGDLKFRSPLPSACRETT